MFHQEASVETIKLINQLRIYSGFRDEMVEVQFELPCTCQDWELPLITC